MARGALYVYVLGTEITSIFRKDIHSYCQYELPQQECQQLYYLLVKVLNY